MSCVMRLCLLLAVCCMVHVMAAPVPASTPKKGSVTLKSAPKPAAKPLVKSTTKVGGVKKGATTVKTVKKMTVTPALAAKISVSTGGTKMASLNPSTGSLKPASTAPVGNTTPLIVLPDFVKTMLPPGIGAPEVTYVKAYRKLPPGVTLPPTMTLESLLFQMDALKL